MFLSVSHSHQITIWRFGALLLEAIRTGCECRSHLSAWGGTQESKSWQRNEAGYFQWQGFQLLQVKVWEPFMNSDSCTVFFLEENLVAYTNLGGRYPNVY